MSIARSFLRRRGAWLATDPERYPFIHEIAQEFAAHEDIDQFASGLGSAFAGLRLQAG